MVLTMWTIADYDSNDIERTEQIKLIKLIKLIKQTKRIEFIKRIEIIASVTLVFLYSGGGGHKLLSLFQHFLS